MHLHSEFCRDAQEASSNLLLGLLLQHGLIHGVLVLIVLEIAIARNRLSTQIFLSRAEDHPEDGCGWRQNDKGCRERVGEDSRLARKDNLGDNGPRGRGGHCRDHARLAGLGRDDICASVGLVCTMG